MEPPVFRKGRSRSAQRAARRQAKETIVMMTTDHIPGASTFLYPSFTTELTTTFDRRRFGKHLPIHWRPFFATLREAIVGA